MGVEKSLTQAFHFFQLAANQKDAEGQYHVARFYRLGRQSEDAFFSLHEAIYYYKMSFDQGFRKKRLSLIIQSCNHLFQQYKQLETRR